jgi:hypothetical protein
MFRLKGLTKKRIRETSLKNYRKKLGKESAEILGKCFMKRLKKVCERRRENFLICRELK